MGTFTRRRAVAAITLVAALAPAAMASAATAPPAAPTALTARLANAAVLTWTDNATDETGFVIERALSAQGYGVVGTVGPNVTTFTDPSTAVAAYAYRVRARNDRGFSAYSSPAELFVLSTNGTFPVAIAATSASGTAPLTATFSSTWGTVPGTIANWYFGDGTSAVGTSGVPVSHTFSGFGTYAATLVVRIPSQFGFGYASGTAVTLVTAAAPALRAPTAVRATSTTRSRVALTWTNPVSDATSIRVLRCVQGRCATRATVADLGSSATSFTDTTVSGTTYVYRLVASNAAGATATSTDVTIRSR